MMFWDVWKRHRVTVVHMFAAALRGEKRSGAGDSRAHRRNLKPSASKVAIVDWRLKGNYNEKHQEAIFQWSFRINVSICAFIKDNKGWFRRWCESLTKCFVCQVGPLNVNHWGSMHDSMCTASRKLRVTHTEFDKKGPSAFAIFIAELRLVVELCEHAQINPWRWLFWYSSFKDIHFGWQRSAKHHGSLQFSIRLTGPSCCEGSSLPMITLFLLSWARCLEQGAQPDSNKLKLHRHNIQKGQRAQSTAKPSWMSRIFLFHAQSIKQIQKSR